MCSRFIVYYIELIFGAMSVFFPYSLPMVSYFALLFCFLLRIALFVCKINNNKLIKNFTIALLRRVMVVFFAGVPEAFGHVRRHELPSDLLRRFLSPRGQTDELDNRSPDKGHRRSPQQTTSPGRVFGHGNTGL